MNPYPYPTTITPEVLACTAHLSLEEIRNDLTETVKHVVALRAAMEAYRALSTNLSEPETKQRLHAFMANNKKHTLAGGELLMNYLEMLLAAREGRE